MRVFHACSFFFFFFFPSLFVFTAKLEPKETCSGTRVNDGGRLVLLVLSLVVIGTLFSHRIATRAYDEVPEIFDPKGFV